MRRLARSTASQRHTLRFLRPTNVHISSSSNASQRLRCAFFGRSRGTATLARLWQALPRRYHRHTRYFTDAWRAYPQVLPAAAHRVGKAGTRVVEALNGKLRHRCGVLVRRSRSFSKCRASHYNRIKIAIDQHNLGITLN